MNTIFVEHSIGELIEKIKRHELLPSELVMASLQAIHDDPYSAWVVHADESLLAHTKAQEKNGVATGGILSNIPLGVKDIYNTADFPTQMGSPLWKDFTPGNDARVVFNLKREGAVIIGKTVTAEFAVHALNETLNPYDSTKTPGTSSSGSAVAVALGMVPAATGTQTAGSIVRPASFCGVYAMKPSFGTIPRTGMLKTTDSLDTVGFFTVYQRDLRRMFDAMRVHGKNYPISHAALGDETRQHKGKQRPWRVGFARTHTWDYASKAAKDALERFIHTLATHQGVAVADAPLPKIMEKTHETHATIYDKSLSYYFQNEYAEADFLSPIMNELIERGAAITIEDFKIAIDLQTSMIYKMDAYFGDFDILISLSTAGEAPARNKTELPDPALMWTLTHLPVVSAPVFTSENGLPFGIQIVARKYNDYLLLEFLGYLESLGMIPARSMYARERQGYQNKK